MKPVLPGQGNVKAYPVKADIAADWPAGNKKAVFVAYKITEDCINCWGCIDVCSEGAIIAGDDKSSIDPEKCTDCGICVNEFFCPAQAIIIVSDIDT